MIHIPSNEIQKPGVHADEIGFVFCWEGHLLRGIFPSHKEQVINYFDSGFVEEITNKGLFPKTWISDFYNEQFALIIEHEMITPVIYAQEWNQSMLKEAALMVIEIARVGWKYGFNMIDCHKTNVLFKGNKPLYVDLGSFIPKEDGSTGWLPYKSFLESYTYILDLWSSGAPQIAKRMMSQGVLLSSKDYYAFKHPCFRIFPHLLDIKLRFRELFAFLAILPNSSFTKRGKFWAIIKSLANHLSFLPSQNFKYYEKRLRRMRIIEKNIEQKQLTTSEYSFWESITTAYNSIMLVNCDNTAIIDLLRKGIVVNSSYEESNSLYRQLKNRMIETVCFDISNPVLIRGKFPEKRFLNDAVIVANIKLTGRKFEVHNLLSSLFSYGVYSRSGDIVLCFSHLLSSTQKKEITDNLLIKEAFVFDSNEAFIVQLSERSTQ